MQEYGSIIAQIVTSAAQIPVAGATLTISRKLPDGVLVRGAQVFSGVQTLQQLVLIPTPTLPENYAETQEFDIPAQEL